MIKLRDYIPALRYGAKVMPIDILNGGATAAQVGRNYWVKSSSGTDYTAFLSEYNVVYADGSSSVQNTITAAISAATASRGDNIYVTQGYTETVTSPIAISKAGLSVYGLGNGLLRPTITVNAAADGISMSAANCLLDNFYFAAPETDEATSMVDITAAGCTISNLRGVGSKTSKNFVDCITIASGADDLTIENVDFFNTTVAVNSFLSIEAAVARLTVRKFRAFGDVATAGIIDAATATQIQLEDVIVGVVGTTKPAATLDSNPTGWARNCTFYGTSTTLANNAALGTGLRLDNIKVLEETDGSKSAAIIPAVDVD